MPKKPKRLRLLSAKHSSRLDGMKLQTMRLDTRVNGCSSRHQPAITEIEAETHVPIYGGLDRIVFCVNLPRQRGKFYSMIVVTSVS